LEKKGKGQKTTRNEEKTRGRCPGKETDSIWKRMIYMIPGKGKYRTEITKKFG